MDTILHYSELPTPLHPPRLKLAHLPDPRPSNTKMKNDQTFAIQC